MEEDFGFEFPVGKRWRVERGDIDEGGKVVSAEWGTLVVGTPGGETLRLPDAFAAKDKVVYLVGREEEGDVLIVGGPVIWRVGAQGEVRSWQTRPSYDSERLWETFVATAGEGILVVYDRDLLWFDGELELRWEREKRWMDKFLLVDEEAGEAVFSREDEEELFFRVKLRDGAGVPAL
jgi:hypothetical protein